MKRFLLLLLIVLVIPAHADEVNPAEYLSGWWSDCSEYFYFGPYIAYDLSGYLPEGDSSPRINR